MVPVFLSWSNLALMTSFSLQWLLQCNSNEIMSILQLVTKCFMVLLQKELLRYTWKFLCNLVSFMPLPEYLLTVNCEIWPFHICF